jgi:hypothetical protein
MLYFRYYNFYGIGTFLLYYNQHIGTRVCHGQSSIEKAIITLTEILSKHTHDCI